MDPADFEPASGVWVSPLQMTNRPYVVPATGEHRPTELHDLGDVVFGRADEDVRALVAASDDTVEVRLPWAILGFSDPSSRLLYVQHPSGGVDTLETDRVGIAVHAGGALLATTGYAWDPWNRVEWHERRKAGFENVAEAMRELCERRAGEG